MEVEEVKLVDTSSWIDFLRGRDTPAAERVNELLRMEEAGWCELIAAELWNGARDPEMKSLTDLEEAVIHFPINAEVWRDAIDLAQVCRRAGLTVPTTDIIIAACAFHYDLEMEACDTHFAEIEKTRRRRKR